MKKIVLALVASVLVASAAGAQKDTSKVTQAAGGDVVTKYKSIPLGVYNSMTGDTITAIVEDTLTGVSVNVPGGTVLNLTSLILNSPVFPFAVIRVRREGYAPVVFKLNALTDTASRTIVLEPR